MLTLFPPGHASSRPVPPFRNGRRDGAMRISARHRLLGGFWTSSVESLERAISRFKADSRLASTCDVVFFEIDGDEHLHCNVTHRHATKTVSGWAGPGRVPDGFVHNRRFGNMPHSDMVRHIRDMIFAPRL